VSRLAIDAGGTWLRYEVVGQKSLCGRVSSKEVDLWQFISSMLEKEPDIDAVAVSFAGQVHEGEIISAPNIKVKERELQTLAETLYGIPLKIENDLNCAALAESVYWNEKELVAIYSGTGLGAGIVSRGEILHGWRSLAGEIGHIPYKEAPFTCGCGKRNCIELYASGSGLKKWLEELGCGKKPVLEELRASPKSECREIAKMYEEALLHAVATAVTLLNPKAVVLGGGVVEHNPYLLEVVSENIANFALKPSCEGLEVRMSEIEDASLEGAKLLLDTITYEL